MSNSFQSSFQKEIDSKLNSSFGEEGLGKNTIQIKGDTYKIKLLSFEYGITVWEDIMKRLLPSIGNGLDQLQHNELDGNPNTFVYALTNISRQLDGEVLVRYSRALFEGATVNGEKLDINRFTGNYGTWKKLFMFAIKENFSSFFEEGWTDSISNLTAMLTPMMGNHE